MKPQPNIYRITFTVRDDTGTGELSPGLLADSMRRHIIHEMGNDPTIHITYEVRRLT